MGKSGGAHSPLRGDARPATRGSPGAKAAVMADLQERAGQAGLRQYGVVDGGSSTFPFEKNRCCPVSEVHQQSIVVGWLGAGSSSEDGARTPMRGVEVDLVATREAPDMAAEGRARRTGRGSMKAHRASREIPSSVSRSHAMRGTPKAAGIESWRGEAITRGGDERWFPDERSAGKGRRA